jgi:hypothetical protein
MSAAGAWAAHRQAEVRHMRGVHAGASNTSLLCMLTTEGPGNGPVCAGCAGIRVQTAVPALLDVTPATIAEWLGTVGGPAALPVAALQLEAVSALGGLPPREGLPEAVIQARCLAAGACSEWLRSVLEIHADQPDQ